MKTYKSNEYATYVTIDGPSKLVYSPDKPLSCGAKVWIEAKYEDVVLGLLVVITSMSCTMNAHGCWWGNQVYDQECVDEH